MTTLCAIELTCPLCLTVVQSHAVATTNAFGGKRTDFHERAAGTQPLPYLIHSCPACGFTAAEKDYRDPPFATADPMLRAAMQDILDTHFPATMRTRWTAADRYECAARLSPYLHGLERDMADLWHRAAWCCVDAGDTEAERFYRIRAAQCFATALCAFDGGGVADGERAVVTYLVGELWRRIGHEQRAAEWFGRVGDEILDSAAQGWVLDAARQQQAAPMEWFHQSHHGSAR